MLVDYEPPDSGATDRQPTNSESADGQRANRDGGKRQRPNRLGPDADRWEMSRSSLGIGSIVVGDAYTRFTRRHQMALDGLFDSGAILRGLTTGVQPLARARRGRRPRWRASDSRLQRHVRRCSRCPLEMAAW
jgi:hypothetical protein